MKTKQFIQTVNTVAYLTSRNLKLSDIIFKIDTLRKLHVRLQSMCEYLLNDPMSFESEHERDKIKKCAIEIREFAIESKIIVMFEKFGNDYIEFSKKFRNEKKFTSYWYKNIEITDLIVFVEKKRIKYKNKKIESIAESSLDVVDLVILDENGVDINKINGNSL